MIDVSMAMTILSSRIRARAWRLHLETPGVFATVPMVRGVWGAALRAESEAVYRDLFDGGESGVPRYLMRPAPPEVLPAPAIEFLRFGAEAGDADEAVWAAWDRAGWLGLGPDRRPFRIVASIPLAWEETPLRPGRLHPGFALAPLPWPIDDPASGCRLDSRPPCG
jgi:hypothetical protein